jgi:hypothetical protein
MLFTMLIDEQTKRNSIAFRGFTEAKHDMGEFAARVRGKTTGARREL